MKSIVNSKNYEIDKLQQEILNIKMEILPSKNTPLFKDLDYKLSEKLDHMEQ